MSRSGFATAAGIVLAAVASAQTGFEGEWSLDAARGRNLPPGMEQKMTIEGESGGLRVQTTIVTDFGERVQDDRYVFDGAEHDAKAPGASSGVRTASRDGERAFRAVDHLKGSCLERFRLAAIERYERNKRLRGGRIALVRLQVDK